MLFREQQFVYHHTGHVARCGVLIKIFFFVVCVVELKKNTTCIFEASKVYVESATWQVKMKRPPPLRS